MFTAKHRITRWLFILLITVASMFVGGVLADDVVELVVYSSKTCDTCAIVKEQVLQPLQEGYGDRLVITVVEVSTAEGLATLEAVEERYGQLNNPLPVIQLGDELLANEDFFQLEEMLVERLEERLGPAGGGTPQLPPTTATAASPKAIATASDPQAAVIHVAYVEKDGCSHCARALVALESLQAEYPGMVIETFNNMRDADLLEALAAHLTLPEERRLIAPSVYIGERALVNEEITTGNLRVLLDEYVDAGAPAFWETLDTEAGQNSILARFQRMGPFAVVLAALIDGINPCAFATILFFVSYLAMTRRKRRELLIIGLAFTAGVFVTYLAVGLGAMSLLKLASAISIVGTILYGLMGLTCFVLAGISIHDYILARQGRLKDMALNLPEKLRNQIKGRIRGASGAFAGAAFVSGLIVSLLELACTGQVYLPTISFVIGIPEMRASAVAYLVVYNLFFILPLLVVLLLAVYGISAARFQAWFEQNAARTKLIMAILFVLLGALLVSQLFAL